MSANLHFEVFTNKLKRFRLIICTFCNWKWFAFAWSSEVNFAKTFDGNQIKPLQMNKYLENCTVIFGFAVADRVFTKFSPIDTAFDQKRLWTKFSKFESVPNIVSTSFVCFVHFVQITTNSSMKMEMNWSISHGFVVFVSDFWLVCVAHSLNFMFLKILCS